MLEFLSNILYRVLKVLKTCFHGNKSIKLTFFGINDGTALENDVLVTGYRQTISDISDQQNKTTTKKNPCLNCF